MSINSETYFYKFGSEVYLNTFYVSPDLYVNALKHNLRGPSGREIHLQRK